MDDRPAAYADAVARLAALAAFGHATRGLIKAFGHDGALTQMAAMTLEVMKDYETVHGQQMSAPSGKVR